MSLSFRSLDVMVSYDISRMDKWAYSSPLALGREPWMTTFASRQRAREREGDGDRGWRAGEQEKEEVATFGLG